MQGDHEFNVFIQANLVTGPSPYDPSRDPALAPDFGRDKVVARAFWNRIVGASGLEIRSVPVPPQGAQAGDSFELAIEVVESTHSDVHTRKVVVDD